MILVAFVLLYLAIVKKFEPLLLLPIAFGVLLANLPLAGLMAEPANGQIGGLLYYLYQGVKLGIYPSLIFLGVGAMTDFGPLLSNPISLLLGAAAQLGIYVAFIIASLLNFTPQEAASIAIIGGADGPTAIFLTTRLAPHLLPGDSVPDCRRGGRQFLIQLGILKGGRKAADELFCTVIDALSVFKRIGQCGKTVLGKANALLNAYDPVTDVRRLELLAERRKASPDLRQFAEIIEERRGAIAELLHLTCQLVAAKGVGNRFESLEGELGTIVDALAPLAHLAAFKQRAELAHLSADLRKRLYFPAGVLRAVAKCLDFRGDVRGAD